MLETLSSALLEFLREWGEVAIFVIFLLEESGVPLPLPGDLALIWAGYHVASGQSRFVVLAEILNVAWMIWLLVVAWRMKRDLGPPRRVVASEEPGRMTRPRSMPLGREGS